MHVLIRYARETQRMSRDVRESLTAQGVDAPNRLGARPTLRGRGHFWLGTPQAARPTITLKLQPLNEIGPHPLHLSRVNPSTPSI